MKCRILTLAKLLLHGVAGSSQQTDLSIYSDEGLASTAQGRLNRHLQIGRPGSSNALHIHTPLHLLVTVRGQQIMASRANSFADHSRQHAKAPRPPLTATGPPSPPVAHAISAKGVVPPEALPTSPTSTASARGARYKQRTADKRSDSPTAKHISGRERRYQRVARLPTLTELMQTCWLPQSSDAFHSRGARDRCSRRGRR